jgi:hypothetical protein
MKKFFTIFFVILGIVFFILIIAVAYTYTTNKTDLSIQNPETKEENEPKTTSPKDSPATTTEDKNPILSPNQEKALETVGINPSTIPSSFTPEQIQCFEEKLGKERVEEIKNGDTPTATEMIKGKGCL